MKQILVIVGDAPWDIQASGFAGFACVVVATGLFGLVELEKCDSDLLIQDLSIGFKSLTSFIVIRFRF